MEGIFQLIERLLSTLKNSNLNSLQKEEIKKRMRKSSKYLRTSSIDSNTAVASKAFITSCTFAKGSYTLVKKAERQLSDMESCTSREIFFDDILLVRVTGLKLYESSSVPHNSTFLGTESPLQTLSVLKEIYFCPSTKKIGIISRIFMDAESTCSTQLLTLARLSRDISGIFPDNKTNVVLFTTDRVDSKIFQYEKSTLEENGVTIYCSNFESALNSFLGNLTRN